MMILYTKFLQIFFAVIDEEPTACGLANKGLDSQKYTVLTSIVTFELCYFYVE